MGQRKKKNRKWYFLQPDGAADEPQEALGGATPLAYAQTPALDQMVPTAQCYRLKTIPDGFPPGSDIGNLSLLGYDPRRFFTGRSPIEAAAMGIALNEGEYAFRCNFVNITGAGNEATMTDFSAGHISTEEAGELVDALNAAIDGVQLYAGVSYRQTLVAKIEAGDLKTQPPHDIQDQQVGPYLPSGDGADVCATWMRTAHEVLAAHPVNKARVARGERPATDIWVWGQGKATTLPAFSGRHNGRSGAMITAVDLLRGLAVLSGMENIQVPGVTGFIDTNYSGKAEAAIASKADMVFLHLEAPDESSHMGNTEYKIQSIERFDREIVAPILAAARDENACIIVTPDHPTLLRTKGHALADVPCMVWAPDKHFDGASGYDEGIVESAPLLLGWELLDNVGRNFQ